MDLITEAYERIKAALNVKLSSEGYSPVHEQNDDAVFESRYIVWSNDEDALRLTWDGKESYFILEVADTLPLSSATVWDDLIISSFEPDKHDLSHLNLLISEILDSLN